ncbi:MAG: helix-turn-helix transcriptional regulator [Planctomycetota bacterium]|nr:helix-turn-helix transcriptional regulator [Planctomycetota bacterium]
MATRTPSDDTRRIFWQVTSYNFDQYVENDGRWSLSNHNRERRGVVIFQYAARGCLLYRDPKGERAVPEGWAALFSFGEESWYGLPKHFPEPLLTQFVSLEGAGLLAHVNFIRERFGSVFRVGHENPLRENMRQIAESSRPRTAAEAALHGAEVCAFLMRLYTFLEEQWAREKPPVERAVDELLRRPANAWSLKEVAQRHGCSREHLTRVFTERTGTPPAKYLSRAKLARAVELLRETGLPIAKVAAQSGFANKFTLARHVKDVTGTSPGRLRERTRKRR